MKQWALVLVLLAARGAAQAQWEIQNSGTTADLRGIDNVGGGVAWASGTNGTVLRTEDGGYLWQTCAIPPGAEHLDFRGIQAFDANTAIVMSSGKGDLSRLYKTTDGCQTWKLVFTNPDKDGFWDAVKFAQVPAMGRKPARWRGAVLGDPVYGRISEFESLDDGDNWERITGDEARTPSARPNEAVFAASNTSLLIDMDGSELFVTGGKAGARSVVLSEYVKHDPFVSWKYVGGNIPLARGETAGAFSVAIPPDSQYAELKSPDGTSSLHVALANTDPKNKWRLLYLPKGALVAVGGDYREPESLRGTAALSFDSGLHWTASTTPPHGYRSAVAYDAASKTWITVGPNGTDISTDDGKNWRALRPDAAMHEAPDADRNWNALSLPFVVGPHGRIGKLKPKALVLTAH